MSKNNRDQTVKLLNNSTIEEDYEVESDYQASAYDYDTGAESVSSGNSTSSRGSKSPSKLAKHFKPSAKKKIQLTFKDLTVQTIPRRKQLFCCQYGEPKTQPKVILDNVSGTIIPGQFVAILGSSGAGKTTFLNFLSGRVIGLGKSLKMQGKVLINGRERDKMTGSEALSCYVQQDDILFQTMTVRECLMFAAKLKLKGTAEEKTERVEEVIKDLRLTKC